MSSDMNKPMVQVLPVTAPQRLPQVVLFSLIIGISSSGVADIVHLDDVIIDGSLCTGFDCVNGESFGFDTIRIKENNLRIKAQDTSASASFPSNDWQITFNDTANGGLNKFSIDDIDGGRTPFTIEAGAPSHSLYVDDGGRLGLGTSTPAVDLHILSGNTPTTRLAQDGSSGFTPQTWDMAGNEANFFIRDATNGSTLPFRIQPGAPSNAIYIATGGNIGIGDSSPDAPLDIERSNKTAQLRIEDTSASTDPLSMIHLINKGRTFIEMENNNVADATWKFGPKDQYFAFQNGERQIGLRLFPDGKVSMGDFTDSNVEFTVKPDGNAIVRNEISAVAFNTTSSRASKENFSEIDVNTVLEAVNNLEITRWNFIGNKDVQHIGPVAEDFYARFSVGSDAEHIATVDADGVALAAIQAMSKKLDAKQKEIDDLKMLVTELAEKVDSIANDEKSDMRNDTAVSYPRVTSDDLRGL